MAVGNIVNLVSSDTQRLELVSPCNYRRGRELIMLFAMFYFKPKIFCLNFFCLHHLEALLMFVSLETTFSTLAF